jgi:hypothetical protein
MTDSSPHERDVRTEGTEKFSSLRGYLDLKEIEAQLTA